jgi:hypothetical protein
MTNSENKNLYEGKEDSDKNDRPLSREGWIMLLSGELNYLKMETLGLATIFFAGALACLGGIIAFITEKNVRYILVFSVFASYFIALVLIRCLKSIKVVKPIERIREGIILEEKGFKTYDEIRNQCKNAGVILTKNKNRLDKPEMDNANKEQKEVLQVPQSDIRDIKESLRRIEDINEDSLFYSNWHTSGSLLIAIGFAILSIGLAIFSIRVSLGDANPSGIDKTTIIGFLLIFAGLFMIGGTYSAGKNMNFKKRWKNKPISLGMIFLGIVLLCLAFIYAVIGLGLNV